MPADPENPITAFAKELAQQLPVKQIYEDAGSPAAKQTGQILEDILKVLQLALAPIQFVAALQDRYRRFIDTSVRRVPEPRRISPPPQIVGPVLEGIRYEPECTPIDEMFSELLSKSMDSEHVDEAHPAFPIIVRQSSFDEAIILKRLYGREFDYVYTRDYDRRTNLFQGLRIEVDTLPREGLVFPHNVRFYFEHLHQLGLAGVFQVGNQDPLMDPASNTQIGTRARCKYRLTDLGSRFTHACTTPSQSDDKKTTDAK